MKKYTAPAVEVEKFTVADVITESVTGPDTNDTTVDRDVVDVLSAGLSVDDEF